VNAKQVELLDNARLLEQLRRLERRKGRTGKDSIDHPPRLSDDVANAVAGALSLTAKTVLHPGIPIGVGHVQPFDRTALGPPAAVEAPRPSRSAAPIGCGSSGISLGSGDRGSRSREYTGARPVRTNRSGGWDYDD
jgi:hypothetical protein